MELVSELIIKIEPDLYYHLKLLHSDIEGILLSKSRLVDERIRGMTIIIVID